MIKKIIYIIFCGVGGLLIGFYAGQITEMPGCILFSLGVCILTFSIVQLSKLK